MFLSETSIRRPVFTTMVTLALMTLGLLSAHYLGVDLFPDVSFPVVTVTTSYPGAGPEEVEQLVTKPIEEQISAVNGVDEVRSYSRDSVSTVVVQFKLEADVKMGATDVRDKVAAIRATLPRDVKEPVVQRMDPTALPILTYAVSSARDSAETRRIAEDSVKPRIEAVRPRLGAGDERRVAVLGGLADGDEIAVAGLGNLSDGMAVRRAPSPVEGERAAAGAVRSRATRPASTP